MAEVIIIEWSSIECNSRRVKSDLTEEKNATPKRHWHTKANSILSLIFVDVNTNRTPNKDPLKAQTIKIVWFGFVM